MHDVIVIGAGPIGCYTAYQLSKDGFDVLALEKNASFTYPRTCTGIISVEAFKRFNLPEDSVLSEVKDILFFSPSGLSLAYRPESIQAFVVDRTAFDQRLRDLALKNGADIRLNSPCCGIQIKDTHVEVRINDAGEPVKAKTVVIASGFDNKLSVNMGLGRSCDYLQGVQTEVTMEGLKETEVHLGDDIAPGSFAWVTGIKDGRARIGLSTKQDAVVYLRKFLETSALKDRIKEKGIVLGKLIPIGSLQKTFSERMLVVGEAAGHVKTTTHGGIYYGLMSSQFAVETLRNAFTEGHFGTRMMKKYEIRWKDAINAEIKTGCMLRRFFSHLQNEQIDRLFKIALSNGVMDIVYKKARFDWHSDLIFSLIRHSLFKHVSKNENSLSTDSLNKIVYG
jgi:digeranylgeranylglycerophospholipid reductase